jgi:hypothetical protein
MMGRSGAPAGEQPGLSVDLQAAAAMMGVLKLLADPKALGEAIASFNEAAALYMKAKDESDAAMATLGQERENFEAMHSAKYAEFSTRDTDLANREQKLADALLEVGKREAAIGAREAKLRAALA